MRKSELKTKLFFEIVRGANEEAWVELGFFHKVICWLLGTRGELKRAIDMSEELLGRYNGISLKELESEVKNKQKIKTG